MQITSLLAFLVPAICVATAIPPNTTPQGLIEPRSPVSGSIIAPAPNPYPFVVSLIDGNRRHFCGGTLIGPKFVLTATHCLHGKQIREIIVSYGSRVSPTMPTYNIYRSVCSLTNIWRSIGRPDHMLVSSPDMIILNTSWTLLF